MGRVLPCTTTTPIHGNLLQLRVLPTPRSYMLSTDNGGSYRRNRRDIRVVSPMTPPRVTNPSTPPRAIPVHPTNCVTPSHIATTTPGSNDNGKNATQPSNGTTEK